MHRQSSSADRTRYGESDQSKPLTRVSQIILFILFLLVSQNACFLIFDYFLPFPKLPSFSLAFNRFCSLAWPHPTGVLHICFLQPLLSLSLSVSLATEANQPTNQPANSQSPVPSKGRQARHKTFIFLKADLYIRHIAHPAKADNPQRAVPRAAVI